MTLDQLSGDLVVHAPHAGLDAPPETRGQFTVSDHDLASKAIASADLWTDQLALAAWPAASHVSTRISRLVVDVERFLDDRLPSPGPAAAPVLSDKTRTPIVSVRSVRSRARPDKSQASPA